MNIHGMLNVNLPLSFAWKRPKNIATLLYWFISDIKDRARPRYFPCVGKRQTIPVFTVRSGVNATNDRWTWPSRIGNKELILATLSHPRNGGCRGEY